MINVVMKLLARYLNSHATFVYKIGDAQTENVDAFTDICMIILFICLPFRFYFWWLQFRQSGARTPQCTMLGALTKPSDESVLKVKLLACFNFFVNKPVVTMAECPP